MVTLHCALLEDSLPEKHNTHIIITNNVSRKKRWRGKRFQVTTSPFRFRCIARSTATVTGKDSAVLISVCCTDVMSGVVLEDLLLCLICDFLGVVGEGARSAASTSSDKSSPWLSESSWASTPAGTKPAVRVMCTLRAAPCRSAAERLNSGYTPVKPEHWDYTQPSFN